ncbi:MAG: MBL fold metallo-hydrolase [Dehalococcoidia bacterium]|jgi:L-ascorbate metabolism protein UlaG (beta-lactamase superfamily)|nr:MBL fold metallo-hydrolase [Dehalococcoidia bacterium]MDP6226500.1 MBL fold metallo-hydrolase [Dehalococcoidia bacterium]MDP7084770.1 MBL fold metallo-hydrolase [Dehalococcoidia bacterium]MDP7201547.1 MBL fold metallo-hydrolase [Dehalococcoidia bacterium]MDP7511859.1 MBL fold metallo-hydrolase [Dehalococcoidia bacterium]
MDITWLGHGCFRIRSNDLVVVTDPYSLTLGLRPDPRPATVVTVSNSHINHNNWEEITGEPHVFSAPGEYEYRGISARGVMTPLAPESPPERRNVAFSIELDSVNVCHLGDIALPLSTRQVDGLMPVDVLLVPVGGGCTLDLDQVLQNIQDLGPKIVIPMHHSIPGVDVPLQGVDTFMRRMGLSDIQPQPRLVVTATNLPADMKVVLLAPQARLA